MRKHENLESLRDAMIICDEEVVDRHGQWRTDLPVFGGAAPANTEGVWSWDRHRLLVGTCAQDLEIIPRPEEV